MSFIDIFSWIVLIALLAILVAVFAALGIIPGRIPAWPDRRPGAGETAEDGIRRRRTR